MTKFINYIFSARTFKFNEIKLIINQILRTYALNHGIYLITDWAVNLIILVKRCNNFKRWDFKSLSEKRSSWYCKTLFFLQNFSRKSLNGWYFKFKRRRRNSRSINLGFRRKSERSSFRALLFKRKNKQEKFKNKGNLITDVRKA
jgi:hypothetical protein